MIANRPVTPHRSHAGWRFVLPLVVVLLLVLTPFGSSLAQQATQEPTPTESASGDGIPLDLPFDASTPSGTPAGATPTRGTPAAATLTAATPTAGGTPATSAGTPSAEALGCQGPCLVRIAATGKTDAALKATGMRPSYRTDAAVWVGGAPADLGRLVANGADVLAVSDAMPSLNLYAVTGSDGSPSADDLADFGTIVDTAGPTAIVRVSTVPAVVLGPISSGYRVEKVTPYVPAGTPLLTIDTMRHLPPVGTVIDRFPDASDAEVTRTLTDLQSNAAAPGQLGTRYFDQPGNAIAAEYVYLRYAALGLTVWYEDYIASNGMLSLNVVAEIPGEDSSAIFAVFAHYDSIADDTPGNDVAPGVLDNGTGQAIMLENARLLTGYHLQNPIRFIALDGEEVGFQGSIAFGQRAQRENTPYVGGINIDSVGTALGERRLIVNAVGDNGFIQDALVRQYDAHGFALNLLVRQNPAIVSDETELTNAGIPTILVGSMVYGDPLINCSCDTLDGVDVDYVRATARLVMLTSAALQDNPDAATPTAP